MTILKRIPGLVFLLPVIISINACNNTPKTPAIPANAAKPVVVEKLNAENEKLLKHFKERADFPVTIDSAFMSKVNRFDSLGSNEVKMLAKEWFFDSNLELVFDYELKDFYTIDSAKAKGTYKKWAKKLNIGMTALSNAYALQKTRLNDTTILLLWALNYSSYEADPIYNITHVFYSRLCHNNIVESFLIGELAASADPPNSGQTIIAGKLGQEGNLTLDKVTREDDEDDEVGKITRGHYEYVLSNGKLHFKTKNESTTPGKKVKA